MEPAEVMGLASVMLDFSVTTVQVNSQSHLKLRLFRTMGARHLAPAEFQAITFGKQCYEFAILRPFLAIFPQTTLRTFEKFSFSQTFEVPNMHKS